MLACHLTTIRYQNSLTNYDKKWRLNNHIYSLQSARRRWHLQTVSLFIAIYSDVSSVSVFIWFFLPPPPVPALYCFPFSFFFLLCLILILKNCSYKLHTFIHLPLSNSHQNIHTAAHINFSKNLIQNDTVIDFKKINFKEYRKNLIRIPKVSQWNNNAINLFIS